jgi:hypothetical protein
MELQIFHTKPNETLNRMLVSVSAEIMLICATVLLLFAYFRIDLFLATIASIFVFFFGSIFCWKSFTYSQTVLLFSMAATEFVLLDFLPYFLIPFILLDLLAIFILSKMWAA